MEKNTRHLKGKKYRNSRKKEGKYKVKKENANKPGRKIQERGGNIGIKGRK